MTEHPSSSELLTEATAPHDAGPVQEHLATCLPCQVVLRRLRAHLAQASEGAGAAPDIASVAPALPGTLVAALAEGSTNVPAPGELWRVTGREGMIVLVRGLVDNETVDAIPVTLDAEMADDQTLLVPLDVSPLACELAVFVGFRSHVHVGAFVNRLGDLTSVVTDVELLSSGAMPASVSGAVGSAITNSDDQRLEYYQFLRMRLSELAPSAWIRATVHSDRDLPTERLEARIPGLQVRASLEEPENASPEIAVLARAVCLNSVVLVCRFEADPNLGIDMATVASACRQVVRNEPDADAIAAFWPVRDQPAILFTRQDLRDAIGLPSGTNAPPTPSLGGLPLVDLLFKHFDGSVLPTSWGPGSRLGGAVVGKLTSRTRVLAEQRASDFAAQAGRAVTPEKRSGWGTAAAQVDVVVRFVERLEAGDPEGALRLIGGDLES